MIQACRFGIDGVSRTTVANRLEREEKRCRMQCKLQLHQGLRWQLRSHRLLAFGGCCVSANAYQYLVESLLLVVCLTIDRT